MKKEYKPLFLYSFDDKPIVNKITFNSFVKHVWELSNTNLHYYDFKNLFLDDLKVIFKPIKIKALK